LTPVETELWKQGLEAHQLGAIKTVANHAVARACYLDLGKDQNERKISLGDGDGWFCPARFALAKATTVRVEEEVPLRECRKAAREARKKEELERQRLKE
jgi:hypothetical protein